MTRLRFTRLLSLPAVGRARRGGHGDDRPRGGWVRCRRAGLRAAQHFRRAANASAERIIEAPGGFPSLPNGVKFSNVKVDGKLLSTFHPARLIATGGWTPGPLNGGTFTIKQK